MIEQLPFLLWPFLGLLCIAGIHVYLGLHVVEREVIFVDLSLAQMAVLGASVASLFGGEPEQPMTYALAIGFTVVGAAVFSFTRSDHGRVPQEAIIGIVYAVAAAASVLILNNAPHGAEHIRDVLVGQLLDTFDGELARRHSRASAFGGFLDSVCDHLGDFAVYLGLLWHFLNVDQHIEVVLIATAMFGSVFGSHVRSRAGMSGIDTKAFGVFTRFERTLVLTIGILLNQLTIGLWILAISNNFSALQRIIHVVRAARSGVSPARG